MNDTILLEGLRLECILGDLPHERTFPQELFLDLELTCDELPATRTDALADTVDYVAVAERVRSALIAARCRMIERAAQLAAEAAFACDPRIRAVRVTLRKPHALPGVVAGVRLSRTRSKYMPLSSEEVAALTNRNVLFHVRAEVGSKVFLAGTFNNWNTTTIPMTDKDGTGNFSCILSLPKGRYEYKFIINGTWCADPENDNWVPFRDALASVKIVN